MNKSTFYFVVVILVVYFTLVFCDENRSSVENTKDAAAEGKYDLIDLVEEGRIRRKHHFHGLHHMWGWHALALAYFIKVKVVIVAFFIGAAVFWGLRYFWPHKCHSEIVHEGPVVFDHGPSFANHDHIPYSFEHSDHSDHSFDPSFDASSNFESTASGPYSGYGGPYVETAPSTAPESHHVSRRSAPRQQYMVNEEQIAEFMFAFLGIDSKACRRRFICEVEFRSKHNPLTSMAFRIVGRGFFEKYTNARNTVGHATSFFECATVNPDCTVIEQNIDDEVEEHEPEEAGEVEGQGNGANGNINETNDVAELNANDVDINKLNKDENATVKYEDSANEANLHAERIGMYKRHRRGQKSIDAVAASILNR